MLPSLPRVSLPKIVSLETYPIRIPFEDGGPGTGGTPSRWHMLDMVLIKVEDEHGNIGWGEAFAYFCLEAVNAAVNKMIAPFVVGHVIDDISDWNMALQRKLHLFGRYGITLFALSGIDIALWDLAAKRAGQPLWKLLGGLAPVERAAYASLVRYGTPELVQVHCERALALGYKHVKLHEVAPDVIRRARAVLGPRTPMMVDANCAWNLNEALELREIFSECDVLWVEEPVFPPDDYASMAALESSGVAISFGENASTPFDFARIVDAVTYPQPSMTKVGGVTEFVKILQTSCKAGKTAMPHTPYFGPGYFATLSLLPLTSPDTLVEYLFVDPEAWLTDTPQPRSGILRSLDKPGIGFEPEANVLQRYRAI